MQRLMPILPYCSPLLPNQVQLWQASFSLPKTIITTLQSFLSAAELKRAEKFLLPELRHQFIVARGLLRYFVGTYLEMAPAQVQFKLNQYGKPFINNLEFNISHSHNLMVMAFSRFQQIGVDIEFIRSNLDYNSIAQKNYAAAENRLLQPLAGAAQLHAFFDIWTKKEACIKAVGKGLTIPLNQFAVNLENSQSIWLEREWTLQRLFVSGDYSSAIAVEGKHSDLEHHYFYL